MQKLRDDAQIIQNQYKLLMLLEQEPDPIYARCEFKIGGNPEEQAGDSFLLGLISKKVRKKIWGGAPTDYPLECKRGQR